MDDVQHRGVLRYVGHHLLLQRLGAIGERHVGLDWWPIVLRPAFHQTRHGDCYTLPGDTHGFVYRYGVGAVLLRARLQRLAVFVGSIRKPNSCSADKRRAL